MLFEKSVRKLANWLIPPDTELSEEYVSSPTNAEIRYVKFVLDGIRKSLKTFPNDKVIQANLEDCAFGRLTPPRHRPGIVRVATLNDGATVLFTTARALVDKAHRLTFPNQGEVELYSRTINADCQVVPAPDTTFTGPEGLILGEDATNVLHYCAGGLAVESETGWQHAIDRATELRIQTQSAATQL